MMPDVRGRDEADAVRLAAPAPGDGREMWRIARDSRVLDVNPPYSYLLWCRDFADSSVVARVVDAAARTDAEAAAGPGRLCGFISGYLRPRATDTLFVWQVAVDRTHRGRGLARRMLHHLGDHGYRGGTGRRYLEATVTPDNLPSSRLFEAFARDRGCALDRRTLFTRDQFPSGHRPEVLFRIGPF